MLCPQSVRGMFEGLKHSSDKPSVRKKGGETKGGIYYGLSNAEVWAVILSITLTAIVSIFVAGLIAAVHAPSGH